MANQQTQNDMQEPKLEHAAGATEEVARTARDLSGAFAGSYSAFADGIQELQHGYWRIVQQSVDIAATAPAEMMRCRSLTELSALQREVFTKCLDGVADANRTLMDVSARVAGIAVRPLREPIGRA